MFKSSNEYFDEIFNTDRLENRSDYFVFSEYEIIFYSNLIDYLFDFEDNTQDTFIESEIINIKDSINFINFFAYGEKSENLMINEYVLLSENRRKEMVNEFKNIFFKHRTKNEFRNVKEVIKTFEKILLFLNYKKLNQFNKDEIITLKKDLNKYQNKTPLELTSTPKHEKIFSNNGFVLFEYILKEYVKPTKGRQSDLIYYYWKMYENEPQYIHQRPTEFFIWFENNYDEVFGQLKTLSQVQTPQRNKDFSNALNWFKQQPQQVP